MFSMVWASLGTFHTFMDLTRDILIREIWVVVVFVSFELQIIHIMHALGMYMIDLYI